MGDMQGGRKSKQSLCSAPTGNSLRNNTTAGFQATVLLDSEWRVRVHRAIEGEAFLK